MLFTFAKVNKRGDWDMKKYLSKPVIALFLALGLTVFMYWPVYQKILLSNQTSNIDKEVSRLDLQLKEDIKEILDRSIQLPPNRHELCLKNRNGFHFIHADSNSSGVPFIFYTNDLNQNEFGKVNKLGAMAVNLYYEDNFPKDSLYREFGYPRECITLEATKLKNYSSSTVEYSYVDLNKQTDLDLGDQGRLAVFRSIVGGYSIDTSKSSIYIVARWEFFLLTFITLFGILFTVIKLLTTYWKKILLITTNLFKKDKEYEKT